MCVWGGRFCSQCERGGDVSPLSSARLERSAGGTRSSPREYHVRVGHVRVRVRVVTHAWTDVVFITKDPRIPSKPRLSFFSANQALTSRRRGEGGVVCISSDGEDFSVDVGMQEPYNLREVGRLFVFCGMGTESTICTRRVVLCFDCGH